MEDQELTQPRGGSFLAKFASSRLLCFHHAAGAE